MPSKVALPDLTDVDGLHAYLLCLVNALSYEGHPVRVEELLYFVGEPRHGWESANSRHFNKLSVSNRETLLTAMGDLVDSKHVEATTQGHYLLPDGQKVVSEILPRSAHIDTMTIMTTIPAMGQYRIIPMQNPAGMFRPECHIGHCSFSPLQTSVAKARAVLVEHRRDKHGYGGVG